MSISGRSWPRFCTEDSFTNLAIISGCEAGTACFDPSTSAGEKCSKRPCVPLAKRWSTAKLLVNIHRMRWGLWSNCFVSKDAWKSPAK